MTRLTFLALVGVLVLPGAALAAPAKISPRVSAVSATGTATIEVANPNRYRLRGTATVTVRARTIVKRSVRLPKRSVTSVKLRFNSQAVAALRNAAGSDADGGHGGSTGGQPTPPPSNRWVGRMGTEGPYEDLELTVTGGQTQITMTPFVPVSCFEMGGSYRSALSSSCSTPPARGRSGPTGSSPSAASPSTSS
jgi:hypothetical protein